MAKPGINVYDIRKECVGPLCYDFSDADKYLNRSAGRHTPLFSAVTVCFSVCDQVARRVLGAEGLSRDLDTTRSAGLTLAVVMCVCVCGCLCSAAVKKALGVDEDAEWQECNMFINAAFYGEHSHHTAAHGTVCAVPLWCGRRVAQSSLSTLDCSRGWTGTPTSCVMMRVLLHSEGSLPSGATCCVCVC